MILAVLSSQSIKIERKISTSYQQQQQQHSSPCNSNPAQEEHCNQYDANHMSRILKRSHRTTGSSEQMETPVGKVAVDTSGRGVRLN